jgi:hypothetical protein
MASYKWVAEKAIPFLKKNPNIESKKLQEELEDKYDVKIGYSTMRWQEIKFLVQGMKVLDICSTSRQRLSLECQEVL